MSQIKVEIFFIFLLFCAGCSKANKESIFNSNTGKHNVNWIIDHRAAFLANPEKCVECHGNDNRGGISNISCYSSDFSGTACHPNGPSGHPDGWSSPSQHGIKAEQDFAECKICHGSNYRGSTLTATSCYQCHNGPGLNHPDSTWIVANHKTEALSNNILCQKCHGSDYLGGSSHIACDKCHMENETKVHPSSWYPDVELNHREYVNTKGTDSCSNAYCHGTYLGGVTGSGVSCSTCHTWPLACNTCHKIPPSGSIYPDIAGSHSAHTVLANVDCSSCHMGAGSGTVNHMNNIVDVIFSNEYIAKSGTPEYNSQSGTCVKVSCHGGQVTPGWATGKINVNTQCSSCHTSGTSEYNSYFSGKHSKHRNEGIGCTECHDTNKLSTNHFTDLNSAAMTGANLTIINAANYSGGRCTLDCHDQRHDDFSW